MPGSVIETHGLRKAYGRGRSRVLAVDGLDLSVPAGGVHGFLGPDGSGKTTTLRLLLGLARPTGGTMSVLGRTLPEHQAEVQGRVGALVEEPRFTPAFSGQRNLDLLARAAGVPHARVDEVLELVGLRDRARGRYRGYSAGQRQRLGLAAALLPRPELLLLDEPTRGLDPAGVRDIRDLVRRLAGEGVTVLLGSAQLAEVQQLCTSVSVLARGRLLASGSVEELLGEARSRTRVGVADPDRAEVLLRQGGFGVTREGEHLLVEGHDHPEQVSRLLAGHGVYVTELSAVRPDLESFFLQLTHEGAA